MGKILKYITELVYLILSKSYMLVEGIPVQAELVDVVIFLKLQSNLDKWDTLSPVPTQLSHLSRFSVSLQLLRRPTCF